MKALLADHPEQDFAQYVISGLENGFSIGFNGSRRRTSSPNLPSAFDNAAFISDYLKNACQRGETAGPYLTPPLPDLHCSGLGVVPKKNGRLCPIHHLSSPVGESINDGISPDEFSLHYVSVDHAICLIQHHGHGTYLSKVDVKSAFRICPVRTEDWPLLGIEWKGHFYFDKVLPFGLHSNPFIFNSVADAVEWILQHKFSIRDLIHYLDDYLNVCSGSLQLAKQQLSIILDVFRYLGVPLALDKIEGPAHTIKFLGILLDCIAMGARLPEKLCELRNLL